MASQFSKDGKYFAQLSSDGKLKIWDTATSKFEQEYTPDFHLTSPCTCLHFIQPNFTNNKSGSPRKKIRKSLSEVSNHYVILGTKSGILFVYSITKAEIDFKVDSQTSQSINCLSWQTGMDVYSAGDQTILVWDLQNRTIKSKWKSPNEKISAILLIPGGEQLLTASKNIKLWDINEKEVLKTFVGHSHEISILDYVNPSNSDGGYLISASKGDKILSCWNLNDSSKNAVANFSMQDVAVAISVTVDSEGVTKLAAVTRTGVCHVYEHTLNGKGIKPIKPKTTVQIASDSNKDTAVSSIPIISATFKDDCSLTIGHGIAHIKLTFETAILSMYEKVQCLIRKDPKFQKSNEEEISKLKTPNTDNVQYLSPHTVSTVGKRKSSSGNTMEVPMEKRLENLTLMKLDSDSNVVKVNNVAQLLLQGIHSKDKHILKTVLTNRDENVIKNTVKRLPMAVIMPLVEELTTLVQGKTLSCQIGALWLKMVLQIHAGILLSNPDLSKILSPVLATIESRLHLQAPLSRLRGRLDLLVSQVSTNTSTDAEEETALLFYNDKGSSDSEMDGLELGGHSESENEWVEEDSDEEEDEVEDEVEENGEENSDEDMSN